jgi:monovalent cation:H+ antiporter-2, CPA2 family
MVATPDPGAYKDVVLFLGTAAVVAPLFHRLRISPILGFLAVGVAIGPHGFGAFDDRWPGFAWLTVDADEDIAVAGEFGVVFLLFMIGLELSWARLNALRRLVLGFGAAQVAACGLLIGVVALLLGVPPAGAAVLGAALALSSTAVVMPVLQDRGQADGETGQAAFAVLLFQDLAVAPILIVVGLAGQGGGPEEALGAGLLAVGVLVALTIGLRLLMRPLMHSVARARSTELFLAACLLLVLGAGLVASAAGLSMALGAFIAGLLLAETEYRHSAEALIEPLRGLLLGLFFVSVGIGLDLPLVIQQPALVLGLTAALVLGKAAVILLLARAFGVPRSAAVQAGLVLAPAGEFAFVVLDQASGARLLSPELAGVALVAATLSMFAIPGLAALGRRLGRTADGLREPAPPQAAGAGRVMIVGYGRVGRLVADLLKRHDVGYVLLDRDAARVRAQRREGEPIWFGDGGNPELLKRCGVETAVGLVVTLDEPGAAERVVEAARRLRPDLTIVARARDEDHAHRLYEAGATDAVPETFEAGLQLAENTLVDVGVPMGLVIASVHEVRDEVRARLNLSGTAGDRPRRSVRASRPTPAGDAA